MADIEKCKDEADPNRCQGIMPTKGQCQNMAAKTEGGKYGQFCMAHGGNRFLQSEEKCSLRNYQLDKFKARLSRHADSPGIKSLRDEIAILRMVMEERLNRCKDETDLVLQSGPISDLVMKIDKIVGSCHKLEGSMGQLLDKQALLQFASEVVEIVCEEIEDEAQMERIGNKIMQAVGRDTNESV